MKKRVAIAATLVLAVGALAAAPLVLADRPHGPFGTGMPGHGFGHGFGPFGRLMHVKEELDLSDQQIDQIKAILAEIAKVLTPEQRAKFEKMRMRLLHRTPPAR